MGTESVDLIDAWQNLYVMLGSSSAALIGLLFVAASIHLGQVVSNPGFRVRCYNQTLYLLTFVLGAWSTMLGMEQRQLDVEQREKVGS